MNLVERIKAKAKSNVKRIVLPEGDEPRTVKAAETIREEGLADPILLTAETIAAPENKSRLDAYAAALYELRKAKGLTEEAAAKLVGTHDFKAFETAGSTVHDTTVRTLYRVDVEATPAKDVAPGGASCDNEMRPHFKAKNIMITVEGDAFLYNMVRIISGTLVEVGLHRMDAADIERIIESKNRKNAGHTAPAQGLYLDKVFYEERFETLIDAQTKK